MAPSGPELPPVAGVDNAVDQVKRRIAFEERHPEVRITSPRETGTGLWRASWDTGAPLPYPAEDGAAHPDLKHLLDYLETYFDRPV
jgi:hypothetical protein